MTSFLDYARRGKTEWWRYALASVAAIAGGLLLFSLALLGLMLGGVVGGDLASQLLKPSHPAIFFGVNGLMFGALALGFALSAWAIQGKRPGDILGWWTWRLFLTGAGIWLVVQVVSTGLDFALAPTHFKLTSGAGTPVLALSAFLGLAVQTFAEEFVFRGYLTQGLLLATRRPLVAAIISGLVFGSLHIPNGVPQAVNAVVFGVVTALIAMRTGGIAFTWGLHMVNNLWGAVVVVSANDVFNGAPGLLTASVPQLMMLDVAVGAVALIAVGWLVRLSPRPS